MSNQETVICNINERAIEEVPKQLLRVPIRQHCRQLAGWVFLTVRATLRNMRKSDAVQGSVLDVLDIDVRPSERLLQQWRASKYENNCHNIRYGSTAAGLHDEYVSL